MRSPPTLTTGELLNVTLSLVLILILIALGAWLLRRIVNFGGILQGELRVLGGISLGGRERAVLIQVGERQILLGVAPGVVRTLYVLEQPLTILPASPNFVTTLRTLLHEHGK